MTGALVALAGGGGAIVRYVVDSLVRRHSLVQRHWCRAFPLATFLINVTGSFLVGLVTGAVLFHHASTQWRVVAGTGFCGGYTTFSAAALETVRLAEQRRWATCLTYAFGSLGVALAAAEAGLLLAGG